MFRNSPQPTLSAIMAGIAILRVPDITPLTTAPGPTSVTTSIKPSIMRSIFNKIRNEFDSQLLSK